MACILEELEKTLTKQLGNTKNSKEFKDGAAKAKERVEILSTLLNNVIDMKKAAKNNAQNKVESIEEPELNKSEIVKEVLAKKHKNLAYGKEIERLSNAKPSTVQDIIQAELDKVREKMLAEHRNGLTYKYPEIELEENYKVEADIIVPTETFEQNVNRKIECKE